MSAETSLNSLLSGNAGVTALVSTRIYPDVLPEECAYPALVFARAGTEPIMTIHGARRGAFVDLSIACWARTRSSADAVAAAVIAAIVTTGDAPSGPEAGYDPDTGLYASTVGVQVLET